MYEFPELSPNTRYLMEHLLDTDIREGKLFYSPKLTQAGKDAWPELLRNTFRFGTEQSLTDVLTKDMFVDYNKKNGRLTSGAANRDLAESEFNRFYMRSVCIM